MYCSRLIYSLSSLLLLFITSCGMGSGEKFSSPFRATINPDNADEVTSCYSYSKNTGTRDSSTPTTASPTCYKLGLASLLEGNNPTSKSSSSPTWELARDIHVDTSGNIYITGGTTAADFPTTTGAYSTTFGASPNSTPATDSTGDQGDSDVFLMKLNDLGTLLWSTFIGGPNYDRAYAVEVDSEQNVYVAGRAGDGFPTTAGVIQTDFAGDSNKNHAYGLQDGFISKISADGSQLLWSTYYGSTGRGFIRDIDIDDKGNVYVGAALMSGSPHAMDPPRDKPIGSFDGAYSKISSDGRTPLYGSFVGGNEVGPEWDIPGPSVTLNSQGELLLTSFSDSPDIPTATNATQKTIGGSTDIVLFRILPDGHILPCTYFGGNDFENQETHEITVDTAGYIYLAGASDSPDLMTSEGFQSDYKGKGDAFIAKFSPDCTTLITATYLGGSELDEIEGVVIHNDNVYVSGTTYSSNFPLSSTPFQNQLKGSSDGFVAVIDSNLTTLIYSTYIGGDGKDAGTCIFVNDAGQIYAAGNTTSSDFPNKNGFDNVLNGGSGAMYFRLDPVL